MALRVPDPEAQQVMRAHEPRVSASPGTLENPVTGELSVTAHTQAFTERQRGSIRNLQPGVGQPDSSKGTRSPDHPQAAHGDLQPKRETWISSCS